MNNLDTNLSLRSFSTFRRSNDTLRAISLIIYEFMQPISTCTFDISSMCSTKNSKHSLTNLSIFKKSADIKIVTAFFISNFGPLYYWIADFFGSVFSLHFYTVNCQLLLFVFYPNAPGFYYFFSYSSIEKI